MTARHLDHLPCDHFCPLTCQKENGIRNVFRHDQGTHRNDGPHFFFKFRSNPTGLGGAGRNTVDGDAVFCHFQSDAAGKGFQRCFAGAIGNLASKNLCGIGGKVDALFFITF